MNRRAFYIPRTPPVDLISYRRLTDKPGRFPRLSSGIRLAIFPVRLLLYVLSKSTNIKLRLLITSALLLWILVTWLPVAGAQEPPKRVMVLYWYGKDFPGNVSFDQSFQAALRSAAAGPIEYFPEYLESNRFPGENQAQLLRDYLKQKYADQPPDVIVAAPEPSLNFLLKYRADLFPQTPIVFSTNSRPQMEGLMGDPAGITGIAQAGSYRKTVELALHLHPATRQVFIISGLMDGRNSFETSARQELADFEGRVEISYLTDLPLDELVQKMKRLPERSIVIYLWQQAQDGRGNLLESGGVLTLIAPSATAPIYVGAANYVGRGAVGGNVSSPEARGPKVAEMVLRILGGERAQDIAVEGAPITPMFDWRQLKRWQISEDLLPEGSIIRFKEPTLWAQYKWQITGMLTLLLIQAVLIGGLLAERKRRRKATLALDERLRFETFLSNLSADFAGVKPEEVESKVQLWLQRLVEFKEVDRATFLEFSDDGKLYRVKQAYASAGGKPLPEELLQQEFPWYVEKLRQGTVLKYSGRTEELPKNAPMERRYLEDLGVQSHLSIPISSENSIAFALTLATLREPREWPKAMIRRLRLIGEIFANELTRKRAEEALTRLNAELETRVTERTAALDNKTKELETFAYSIAHDLKAPLRGIDGYSRLLMEDHQEHLDKEGRAFLHTIRLSTTQMSQLIDDLLKYSRFERRTLASARIELRPFIESLVEQKRSERPEDTVTFVLNVNGGTAIADVNGLTQALSNYLDNAVKFSGAAAQPQVEIGAEKYNESWRLWVRDNGVGFDMKYHDRIFEIFQRLHRSEEYPGTGVGLAIVRKAIERMGGRVWAESTLGCGATFYLEIPNRWEYSGD